jgi:uncharacterized membrane protein YecN with MAPEG domain
MAWTVLISVLALLQLFFFSTQVGRMRARYGIKAPAVTGNEIFERYFRVHMNTLELLVMFLPALWFASRYVPPFWPAMVGVVYLIGRFVYFRSYTADPAKRGPGFGLSMMPIILLLLTGLGGAIVELVRGR